MQVFARLDVVAAFLVTGGRLVTKAARQMVEGLAQRLDAYRAKVDLHARSPAGAGVRSAVLVVLVSLQALKRVWVALARVQFQSLGPSSGASGSWGGSICTRLAAQNSANAS